MEEQFNTIVNKESEWSTADIKCCVMIMIEFLKFSPSYELANSIIINELSESEWHELLFELYEQEGEPKLTAKQKQELLEDFQLVLETYQEFGEVMNICCGDWWSKYGNSLFAQDYAEPSVRKISVLKKGSSSDPTITTKLKNYFQNLRANEGNPDAMIISVPLGIDKKNILAQVSQLIDEAAIPIIPKSEKSKKKLTAKRLRIDSLINSYLILVLKTELHYWELWRLGVLGEVSPKNAINLDIMKSTNFKTVDQINNMTILTSRAIRKAKLICENAARGNFPSTEKRLLPYFDFDEISEHINLFEGNKKSKRQLINAIVEYRYKKNKLFR